MVAIEIIKEYKNKADEAISDLDYNIKRCSIEVPRAIEKALNILDEAVGANVFAVEEENRYRKVISGNVTQYERRCSCKTKPPIEVKEEKKKSIWQIMLEERLKD